MCGRACTSAWCQGCEFLAERGELGEETTQVLQEHERHLMVELLVSLDKIDHRGVTETGAGG